MSNPSTGPKTDAGKERAAQNATKHGMRSKRPVLPGEDAAAWDTFRAEVVAELEPVGTIECELAERFALELWRKRRAACFEVEVCTDDYESSVADAVDAMHGLDADGATTAQMARLQEVIDVRKDSLEDARDTLTAAQALPNLPADAAIDETFGLKMYAYAGGNISDPIPHTAGALRWAMARVAGKSEAEALALAVTMAEDDVTVSEEMLADAEKNKQRWCAWYGRQMMKESHDRKLLQKTALDRVIRYEAHVSRQLEQALRLLRQFQAERKAKEAQRAVPIPIPVRSVEAVPEPIARRAAMPARETEAAGSSFGSSAEETPERSAQAGHHEQAGDFARHFATSKHNGTATKEPPREST